MSSPGTWLLSRLRWIGTLSRNGSSDDAFDQTLVTCADSGPIHHSLEPRPRPSPNPVMSLRHASLPDLDRDTALVTTILDGSPEIRRSR